MGEKEYLLKKSYDEIMELYRNNEVFLACDRLQDFLAMASEEGEHYYYAVGLNFLGVLQTAQGNVARSVDYYFECMLYGEKYEVNEILPPVYNNLGSRYMDTGAYETGLFYLKKAEPFYQEVKDTEHVDAALWKQRKIINYINFGLAYNNLKEYQKSNEYLDEAQKLIVNGQVQDMDFACDFLRCQNQYFLGDLDYVHEHIDYLLDGMEELVSLYSYEQNITQMFQFLIKLGERDKIERLLSTVENFAKNRPESYYRLLSHKMRTEYEKNFGTTESYQESCTHLVDVYMEKERETLCEREQYMNLRMELKRLEQERNDEEKRQKKLLAQALREAEKANIAKSEFLSKMSHEIRTPLNAVTGYISMAQNSANDVEKLNTYHKKAQVAAEHLLSIINDVLDISSIASGHFKVEHRAFDFKQIVSDINTIFRQQATAKNIDFSIQLKNLEEEILVGDTMRVKQILLNLLSNAMKFTPSGGKITLMVEQEALDEAVLGTVADSEKDGGSEKKNASEKNPSEKEKAPRRVQMQFRVKDTGIGMTEEFMSKMFTPFEQQDASISRKFGGTGLGLSISKQLAEMMGGDIAVESTVNVGSTFIVTIPVEVAAVDVDMADIGADELDRTGVIGAGATGIGAIHNKFDFGKLRTIIVDVEQDSASYLKSVLKRLKMKSDIVTDREQVLRQLEVRKGGEYEYKFCILNDNVDKENLATLTQQIREQYGAEMLIMALVLDGTAEAAKDIEDAGADAVIEKPLFQSTLVDFLVNRYGNDIKQSNAGKPQVDFSGLSVLIAEDNEMNMEIAEDILTRANLKVDKAFDGHEAWQKFENSPPGTYQAILMDIQMPDMDGYEATAKIRTSNHPQAATMPIIALTANAFNEDVQRALDAGMNGHIAKPINIRALYKLLGKVLDKDKK